MKKSVMKILILTVVLAGFMGFATQSVQAGFVFMGYDFNPPCDMSDTKKIEGTLEEIFHRAEELASKHDYCGAAQSYSKISREASGGALFHEAMFRMIEMLYKSGEYDSSITAAKEYIFWHPLLTQERTEWAYYMIGLNFFLERNHVDEDQRETAKSQLAFSEYLEKYPEGKYVDEAKKILKNSYDELAKREIIVGKFYLKHKQYTAAAVRLQTVPKYFKNSTNLPEALFYISIAFTALEKDKEASSVLVLLQKLFKDSPYVAQTDAFLKKVVELRGEEKMNPPNRIQKLLTCGGIVVGSEGEKCDYSVLKAMEALDINLEEENTNFSWNDIRR